MRSRRAACRRPGCLALLVGMLGAMPAVAQAQPQAVAGPELAIGFATPVIDGDLSDWPPESAAIRLDDESQVILEKDLWRGPTDVSAEFLLSCDAGHLYLAGLVRDDQLRTGQNLVGLDPTDRIELRLYSLADADAAPTRGDEVLQLMPLSSGRPWTWQWAPAAGGPRQPGPQLTGVRVVGKRLDETTYQFEAAIPFHQWQAVRPGSTRVALELSLRDVDDRHGGRGSTLQWGVAAEPGGAVRGVLQLPAPGPLVSATPASALFADELLQDLPFLVVPLATLLLLVALLRGWQRLRQRARWLAPTLIGAGVVMFLLGLWLPGWLADWRAGDQRAHLDASLAVLRDTVAKLEQGTLASYRGASRDRALVDLLAGRSIARQRYTSYRSLAQLAPDQFGPPLRTFDDLPIRPYWIPLSAEQPESFPFDPPLRGTLHLVVARPFVPTFPFAARGAVREPQRLRLELDHGGGDRRAREIDLDRPFAEGTSLGRDFWEVCVLPLPLDRELRALSVLGERGVDLSLVGLSLESQQQGQVVPLLLGAPSLGGVLTDLRGPHPRDAGIELLPRATAKVALPRLDEPPQKLWLFYRAVYPGLPTANPGARVAEVVLHFADPALRRTVVLEHQISMFYELAVHNTRDEPPEGSPAAIALRWTDEGREKHVNLAYPVLDLPAGAALEAIEFRNLAEYRIRFRSVVLGNERPAAPQDPVDAPLVREGQERRLRADVRAQLAGVAVTVYRNGRLSESTLPAEQRADQLSLPRSVAGGEIVAAASLLRDGSRRLGVYAPLGGEGWDGAVLGLSSLDREWAEVGRSDHRLGLALCLLGTPFLLVLLSELLAIVANLRFRLMAVMTAAALLPLGVMSLVLVRVLEDGHAASVQDGVLASVRGAMGQLEEQKEKVRSSARQWLRDLLAASAGRLGGLPDGDAAASGTAVAAELQKLLAGQLPPEWGGGFLRLEWQPESGKASREPLVVVAGDERVANLETPARLDPGVFMQWGMLMLGVRAEESVAGGLLTLTAGRPLDGNLLGALAPGRLVVLTDVRGYPIAASSGHPESELLLREALDPRVMAQRERALAVGAEQRKPTVEHLASATGRHVCGNAVLRDLQDTPRGLLVVTQPDPRATLELAVGRVPVRAFFLLVAGSLVVLAAFLSFVVSSRISRPIERLEQGALALSRGALDTRVPAQESGQIGRLTRTFNRMAADLQARVQDLQALNRAMRELSAPSDEATTLDVLRRFCASHSAADAVRILLIDAASNELFVHAGGAREVAPRAAGRLARFVGSFSCVSRQGLPPEPVAAVLPGCRSAIGLPVAFGGRTRGLVLLGFERTEPLPVDLELLSTVVAQAAIALERSQLHRLAVQDPVTGLITPEYFRRLVVDEVSLAQQHGVSLAMAALLLGDGDRRPRGLRRFVAVLQDEKPPAAVLCHMGSGRFHVLLPGVGRPAAEAFVAAIGAAWSGLAQQLPENEIEDRRPIGVVVQFPDEAPSAEFLFEALRARLEALSTPGAAAMESDESLQRAGVTAVSPAMREVYSTLRRVAPTDLPILLEGETGVGKEVLTNLVHRWSRRAAGPLVKVHCAALSETLLASELFGHERGAFTGADRRKIGRFEQADGGTLFLDEVGDIPLDVQVKLLRVLQEGEVDRVGGTEPVHVDVRVIAATNRDIARLVQAGQFREDLYYRLQGVVVRVPPLRERRQELADLVEHFRREVLASGQGQARSLSPDAMDEIYRQEWPGNVRELRNTVVRAMVLARGDVVHRRDILAAIAGRSQRSAAVAGAGPFGESRAGVAEDLPAAAPTASPVPRPQEDRPLPPEPAAPVPSAAAEPTVVLPDLAAALPAAAPPDPAALPPRLRDLMARIRARGTYSTQDHMEATGVSHRTGLRDLQALVQAGLIERVGTRRGAFYRPLNRHGEGAPAV
ncbi:MAG: sigma 54-interacting transcriptional regulator [Planctomycetes bacterium]|nr:sigma 54-interacting transcriptional regulator [Planctomycetota bacterium]